MNQPNPKAIRDVLAQVNLDYEANFAGQSRATRDLALMDSMIGRVRSLRTDVDALVRSAPGKHQDLVDELKATTEMLESEREQIAKIKSARPEMLDFAALGSQANLIFARYRRHFAGMPRATRDLGLLAELIRQLTDIRDEMKSLAGILPPSATRGDLEVVEGNLKLYNSERGAIMEDRVRGTLEEQSSALAEVANEQFRVYDNHFAGKSRTTRRPELLQRVVENLTQVRDRMQTLKQQGLNTQQNNQNIEVVKQNLSLYSAELEKIRSSRQQAKLSELMGALGGAANEVFEEYGKLFAGQDRRTRDPAVLSNYCDELAEIAMQMETLGRFENQDFNDRNLQIVNERRSMYEREYDLIKQARSDSTLLS